MVAAEWPSLFGAFDRNVRDGLPRRSKDFELSEFTMIRGQREEDFDWNLDLPTTTTTTPNRKAPDPGFA